MTNGEIKMSSVTHNRVRGGEEKHNKMCLRVQAHFTHPNETLSVESITFSQKSYWHIYGCLGTVTQYLQYSEGGRTSALNFNITSICLGCQHCTWWCDAFSPGVGFDFWVDAGDFHPISSECTALRDVQKWGERKEWKFDCDLWWITCLCFKK